MRSERLIVVGPLPPPYHGVTVSTSLVLEGASLRERFVLDHVDTSDHRDGGNIGRWDVTNVLLGLINFASLVSRLRGRRGVLYLPLSQGAPAFLRDSLFIWAASVSGWKVAAHLRGSDFRTFYQASSPLLRRWIRVTLGRVNAVAVMGQSLRWVFEGLVSSEKIAVVANGTVEPPRLHLSRDPEHVLFLSNLRRRKGVVEALEAACIVVRKHPRARFTFVGRWEDATLEAELRRRAAAFDGRIVFLEPTKGRHKDELLASAAILLFPPREPEGHPRVVLEALAAGVPVVTTDRGAIRETVVDGVCGFVLPYPAPEALAACLLSLLGDRELLARHANAARARYLTHFTQDIADRRRAEWLAGVADAT
ncbi:N/A [soil metagenome]